LGRKSPWASESGGARTSHHLLAQDVSTTLDDRGRCRTERRVDDARDPGDDALVGQLQLVPDAAVRDDAVHPCQQLSTVHDQPLEIRGRQLANELVERTARQESLDRE
jgi:hypothetical protein